MMNDILNDGKRRMEKSVKSLEDTLAKMRTGRASPSLLEHIVVPYYGTDTSLSQVARITVQDSRTLSIVPFEDSMVAAIEKAIMTSGLGLNPATSGKNIRIPLPALTEERRKEFVKRVREEAEKGKVSVRNIRRDVNNDLKDLAKEKEISEDEENRGKDRNQKLTDEFISEIDKVLAIKEKDLMEV
jgi:ribosome recycling factor